MTAERFLSQPSDLLHRPIAKHGFTVDVAGVHRAEVATVVRQTAVVPEDEVRIRWHHYFGQGALVFVSERNVMFDEHSAVQNHVAIHDANMVSRYADHALDETLRRVPRIAKYHNVAVLDRFNTINKFIDEDAFLVVQRRHHADALDLYWLVKKYDDERRNANRNDQITPPEGHPCLCPAGTFDRFKIWGRGAWRFQHGSPILLNWMQSR